MSGPFVFIQIDCLVMNLPYFALVTGAVEIDRFRVCCDIESAFRLISVSGEERPQDVTASKCKTAPIMCAKSITL